MAALTGGKLYGSRASAFRAQVQGRNPIRWNPAGLAIEWTKELTAEFGLSGSEFPFANQLTGAQDVAADIRGNAFDSAAQGEEKGWTQEEHDIVVAELDRLCEIMSGEVWVVTAPVAPPPWPTYDSMHHNEIAPFAEKLGLAEPALRYERQKQQRPSVIAKLEDILNAVQAEEELTAA